MGGRESFCQPLIAIGQIFRELGNIVATSEFRKPPRECGGRALVRFGEQDIKGDRGRFRCRDRVREIGHLLSRPGPWTDRFKRAPVDVDDDDLCGGFARACAKRSADVEHDVEGVLADDFEHGVRKQQNGRVEQHKRGKAGDDSRAIARAEPKHCLLGRSGRVLRYRRRGGR
jgi:hypothetical protein